MIRQAFRALQAADLARAAKAVSELFSASKVEADVLNGTGLHSIATARRFENSSVLAVDLSLASLAYAKRKTLEFGIGNIEYRQSDVLALDSIPERFDAIECSGVLHHLEDPLAGWRILCSLMRPSGVMRIGLYSESGRRHVTRARIRRRAGFRADTGGHTAMPCGDPRARR